jgi:predicted ATPase
VFAGINGAGKSTVIQSVLALRQSLQSGSIAQNRIQLRGALTDLGTAGDVYCAEPNSDSIGITMTPFEGPPIELRSVQSKRESRDYSTESFLRLTGQVDVDSASRLFVEPFNYLHAERMGPRKIFPIPSDEGHPLWVGKSGENAPFIVASERRETPVSNEWLTLESPEGKELPTMQYQWPLWMARLFPGFDAKSEIYPLVDQVRLGLALQQTQETRQSLYFRPTNTGFGVSFVLGIIVAGLAAGPGTILIAENPEAHLHPKAQSNVGEFLARVAAGGTQVIVETHSEHVLNGVRRMVKQAIVVPEVARFFFFNKAQNELEPSVEQISVSAGGDFSSWPDGFFDQLDKDLSLILT